MIDPKKADDMPSEQITKYLKYYVGLKTAPNFAVLINGEWGSGKTWFIKKFCKENNPDQFLYVSLYGVSSAAEIEDQIFQQLHPVLGSEAFRFGGRILKEFVKNTIKVNITDIASKKDLEKLLLSAKDKVLIFDDLERCKMKHEEVLGYINNFVEHLGQRVIILAHESEIESPEDYKRKNEKLIGRAFTIQPDIRAAFATFVGALEDRAAIKALEENVDRIVGIYEKASYSNMRTLRYSVMEYQKFYSELPPEAHKNREFITASIQSFFALSIGLKTGKLTPGEIVGIRKRHTGDLVNKSMKKRQGSSDTAPLKEDPVADFFGRLFALDEEIVPNEETLASYFEYGTIQKSVLTDAIGGSRYFVNAETPIWKKLWHVWDLTDSEFESLSRDVERQFRDFKFKKQGELKHVAATLLFHSRKGLVERKVADTMQMIRDTVLEMDKRNLIEVPPDEERRSPRLDDAYAGMGFMDHENDEFREVCSILRKYETRRLSERVRDEAGQVLESIRKDPEGATRLLYHSGDNKTNHYRVPVLKYVPIGAFVDTYLGIHPSDRESVRHIFRERYNVGTVVHGLQEELPWLKELKAELEKRARTLKQPSKYHVEILIEAGVAKAIESVNEVLESQKPPNTN